MFCFFTRTADSGKSFRGPGFGGAGGDVFSGNRQMVDDLHAFPVVGEFLTALEAYDIGPGQRSGRLAIRVPFARHRKADLFVPATEQYVYQVRHYTTSAIAAGNSALDRLSEVN